MRHVKQCLTIALLGITSAAYSDVVADMNNYFNNISYANVTGPQAVEAQQAYYFTGGSAYMRTPSRTLQVANIQFPSINAGCGGIDLFTGGFSFLNSDKLIKFGKAVMQDAPSFAVHIALETFSPMIAKTLQTFESWAQKINNFNMSSCQALQQGYGDIKGLVENGMSQAYACSALSQEMGKYSDWLKSSQKCRQPNVNQSMSREAKKHKEYTNLVHQNRNIVWYALNDYTSYISGSPEIAEFLMSFSGTIIYGQSLKKGHPYPAIYQDDEAPAIKALLYGNRSAHVYYCEDSSYGPEGCLDMGRRKMHVSASEALVPQIRDQLKSIGKHFTNGRKMTQKQANLVKATDLPVVSYIETSIEASGDAPYGALADVVARDILEDYLSDLLQEIEYAINKQADKDDQGHMQMVMDNISRAQHQIEQLEAKANTKLIRKLQMNNQYRRVRSAVAGRLSAQTADFVAGSNQF